MKDQISILKWNPPRPVFVESVSGVGVRYNFFEISSTYDDSLFRRKGVVWNEYLTFEIWSVPSGSHNLRFTGAGSIKRPVSKVRFYPFCSSGPRWQGWVSDRVSRPHCEILFTRDRDGGQDPVTVSPRQVPLTVRYSCLLRCCDVFP